MSKQSKKAVQSLAFWLILLSVIIFIPPLAPVVGIAVIGFYMIKGAGNFLDSHL